MNTKLLENYSKLLKLNNKINNEYQIFIETKGKICQIIKDYYIFFYNFGNRVT